MLKDWGGIAAFILALGVAISITALAIGSALNGHATSELDATLLSTAIGAAVGAVATYIGVKRSTPDE
jgi:hypothetical protein